MEGPSLKILDQESYRDMKIPAWMDFPEEEATYKEDMYEKEMRRKMCIAWLLARKEFSNKIKDNCGGMSEEVERREEVRMMWGEFSDEEVLGAAGLKASGIKRLNQISFFVMRRKIEELEQSYWKKRQLEEAREKGVQLDMELETSNKNYLEFWNMWMAIHSGWGGAFEHITKIRAMTYTISPVPLYVYNYGPPDTLQLFSVKVEGIRDGGLLSWPLHVFGLVAVRDSIDQNRNLIFNRERDEYQTLTKEDPYLVLTGPTRAVVINDESIPVTIEAELKLMSTNGSQDKHLIFAVVALPSQFGSSGSINLTDKYSNLKIGLERMMACVEASIFTRVIEGTWATGSNVQLAARTSSMNHREIVLADFGGDNMPTTDDGDVDLSRFVVSVGLFGELTVSCKAWRGNETVQDEMTFKAKKKGRSYGTLKVGSCILEVLIAWSPIRPVCEELVSMSEMDYAE